MSLAVAENRPQHRNGGCVGIFFQLFSKKKLLSKKLLPPPAKKFAADDKMPMARFMMIADESSGGFPEPEPGSEPDMEGRMQAPGIVARLMGLESMPVVHNEKPRKALDSKFCSGSTCGHSRLDQTLCADNGSGGKGELRPQKLQKTGGGILERRPVEAFHRGLIYGTKKQHHMKLETPVKSPRSLARSGRSRLVQVANKILEPGLQSRSRAKCAITYVVPFEDNVEGEGGVLSDSAVGSYKSCRSLVGARGSSAAECSSFGLEMSIGSEESKKLEPPIDLNEQRKTGLAVIQSRIKVEKGCEAEEPVATGREIKTKTESLAMRAKLSEENREHDLTRRKKYLGNVGDQYGKSVIRRSNMRQGQLSPVGDRMIPGTRICNAKQSEGNMNKLNGAKNFVAMNKNINSHSCSRSLTKVSRSQRTNLEGNGLEKKPAMKRGLANRNIEVFAGDVVKERSVRNNLTSRKGTGHIGNQSVNQSCIRKNLRKMDHNNFIGSSRNGIVSFTFTSPMSRDFRCLTQEKTIQETREENELKEDACQTKTLMLDAKTGSLSSQKGSTLRGDELSSLLEEKIRELSSLDHDELASADDLQGRSTVSILEELISALTTGTHELQKHNDDCSEASTLTEISLSHAQVLNIEDECEGKGQSGFNASYLSNATDQPSPSSILEASFSNGSCSLGSFNGSSGRNLQLDVEETCSTTQLSDVDCDMLDSASSLGIGHSLNNTISTCEVHISETGAAAAVEVISDVELLFEIISLYGSDGTPESSLDSFLLETLEAIMDFSFLSFRPTKEGNRFRELLSDCMMEYLNLKFSHFCGSGFRTWLKLPLILNKERLRREFCVEIREWVDIAGKAMDVIVGKDLCFSDYRWAKCEMEAFDIGTEIQSDILHALIDEMVIDLR